MYIMNNVNPFLIEKILDSSKLREYADDYFKFDENVRKFSKRVETLWEKEKLLIRSNFSFSKGAFKKTCKCRHVKTRACLGKG